jgi:predicted O-methyltransferase YrrM
MINTEWKKWDKYLSHFINTKNNILEIGSHTGKPTSWFLNNLCNNPESLVYALNTREDTDGNNINYLKIDQEFEHNTQKTNKTKQLIIIKNNPSNVLDNSLLYNKYNIIFINASHKTTNIMNESILSWQLLEDKGILIFDDYKYDKLQLDKFIDIFVSELNIINIDYQLIVQKDTHKKLDTELIPYSKLIDKITNYYRFPSVPCGLEISNFKWSIFEGVYKTI